MLRRWQCLEVGCGTVVTAASDAELVAAVNAHMRDAHESYELEEFVLAAAEDHEPEVAGARSSARSRRDGPPAREMR